MERLVAFYKNLFFENRKWFRRTLIWFVTSLVAGAVVFFIRPQLLEEILRIFEEKFGPNPPLDFNLVLDIFKNNLMVSIIATVGGLLFGIGPFLIVVTNGFLIGFVLLALILGGEGVVETLWVLFSTLVPHGVFEIPAFLVSAALGLRLGLNWLSEEAYGRRFATLWQDFKSVWLYFPSITLLLFIAALLEVFVSGNLSK
ncbi:MAG: stage II sporulation protein M [Candidatus Doudnabacteria bacterium]|nr:stage II sporulation protein M [Candidatus Doudnabacteria bacterium]